MSTELAGTDAAEWHPSVNPWLIGLAIMPAVFMEVLDTTITSVALPHIAGGLAASNSESTWVMTSYLVANAIVLPASGWLSLRFGRKRLLLACTVLFTLSSWVCGLAPSMSILILARVLQGAGGALCSPLHRLFCWKASRARNTEWQWRCSAWGSWPLRSSVPIWEAG